MKGEWKESHERTVPLPDDDPKVVDLYTQWLYCGKVLSHDPTLKSEQHSGELDLLVDAFVFGEKIQDALFRDTIINTLMMYTNTPDKQGTSWFPTGNTVRRAYEGTPTGSPLRRLMVNLHNHRGNQTWIKEENSSEFLIDLVRIMFATRPGPNVPDTTKVVDCSYHVHHNTDPCSLVQTRPR